VLDVRGIEQGDANGARRNRDRDLQSIALTGDRPRDSCDRVQVGRDRKTQTIKEVEKPNQGQNCGALVVDSDSWQILDIFLGQMDRRAEAASDEAPAWFPRSAYPYVKPCDLPGPSNDFDGVVSGDPWDGGECPGGPRAA